MKKIAFASLAGLISAAAMAAVTVDFSAPAGRLNPRLHSSGFGPRLTGRDASKGAEIKALHLTAARTHDWALVSPGQRCCDTHFIFPMMKLDPKDPTNYFFAPTDELMRRTHEMGLEVFYRLGTSIEHTGDVFFNAAVPEDFGRYAEVLAGIVRHYTRGWGNGFKYPIRYWEIWNEPDGIDNMWRLPGAEGQDRAGMRKRFARFFAVVLKRLKGEFPDLKFGGPALCWADKEYFAAIFDACKEAGVEPDFVSWHFYGQHPDNLIAQPDEIRRWLDGLGHKSVETVINEWHYLPYPGAWGDYAGGRSQRDRIWEGAAGQNEIDSGVFTLRVLTGFQSTSLGQSFFYGCGQGAWGYADRTTGAYNKTYFALSTFGRIIDECGEFVKVESDREKGANGVDAFGALAKSGGRKYLVVTDFRGNLPTVTVNLKGLGETARVVEAWRMDSRSDQAKADFVLDRGRITLSKEDAYSAAFLVVFE